MVRCYVALAAFAVLLVMFLPLERAWAARPQRVVRKEFALDAMFFVGQYVVWNAIALSVLRWGHHAWLATSVATPSTWPLAVQIPIAVVLGDLSIYWLHRAFHRVGWLWKIHAVHHSSEHLDWLAAYREHPLDGLLVQITVNAPAVLLGLQLSAMGPIIVFRGIWAIVVHSNTTLPLGPLAWVLGSPALHRYHHAKMPVCRHNFSNLAPWVDVLFGTHKQAPDETYPLGVETSEEVRASLAPLVYVRKLLLR